MADMTFKTNLLPKVATGETQSTYSLGSSTQRWKIYGSMPNTMRYATCSTAADTAAKEATIADGGPSFELITGSVVFVKFTNSNNVANPTLNIGSTGAKSIICYGTTAPTTGVDTSWYAGAIITCIYDGTNWCLADFSSRGSSGSIMPRTWYGTCSTASGTGTKVVTCADYTLVKGSIIGVLFSQAHASAQIPKLNINSTGAKSIYVGHITPTTTTNVLKWSANTMIYFMYDGTDYRYITSVAAGSIIQPRGANTWYGTSSTAAGTAAKTSGITNYVLTKGSMVTIAFSTANTVANTLTLNINSTGAKNIWYNNAVTSATNPLYWAINDVLTFIYDGTQYVCVNSPRQDNGIIRSTEDPTNASNYPANTIWIKYGADPMATTADYIIQTGTSDGVCFYRDSNDAWQSTTIAGMWTYNIWASGRAECWGTGQYSLPITQTWGSVYESKKLYAKYPSELFADDTHVMCQITPTSTSAVLLEVGPPDAIGETQQTPSFWLVRATANASTVTYSVNFYARGVSSST